MNFIQPGSVKLTAFIFCVLIFTACASPTLKESENTVREFYTNYKPGDYRVVDKSLLSKDLLAKIEAATIKQAKDAERLKKIASTDKPFMIEGDIYTSLAEGATHHEIIQTVGDADRAKVEIKFKNSFYNHSWNDTVLLVKEGEVWKIDDVFYTKKQGGAASTKTLLSDFILLK